MYGCRLHFLKISIMLWSATKYAGRLVSRLGLGTTTSSFRSEAVRSNSSCGSSNQQQQHCPSSCRSWQLPPTSSPRRSSSPPGRSPASAPEPEPAPSWPTRVPLSTFGWVPPSSVSIHHFWIQLKVTELNRVESSTLPKQRLHQNELFSIEGFKIASLNKNNFSTMFLRCSKSIFSITLAWWLQCSEEQLLFLANRKFTCPVWTGRARWHGLLSGDLLWGQNLIQNLFRRLSSSALDLMI